MDFDEMLEQILELIQRQERVSYRAIKRRFSIEDDYLEDLKEEILFAHPHIVDEEGRGLVWPSEAPPSSENVFPPPETRPRPVSQVDPPTELFNLIESTC